MLGDGSSLRIKLRWQILEGTSHRYHGIRGIASRYLADGMFAPAALFVNKCSGYRRIGGCVLPSYVPAPRPNPLCSASVQGSDACKTMRVTIKDTTPLGDLAETQRFVDPDYVQTNPASARALAMVLDAMRHAVDLLDYPHVLKYQSIFNVYAISAAMAIVTLKHSEAFRVHQRPRLCLKINFAPNAVLLILGFFLSRLAGRPSSSNWTSRRCLGLVLVGIDYRSIYRLRPPPVAPPRAPVLHSCVTAPLPFHVKSAARATGAGTYLSGIRTPIFKSASETVKIGETILVLKDSASPNVVIPENARAVVLDWKKNEIIMPVYVPEGFPHIGALFPTKRLHLQQGFVQATSREDAQIALQIPEDDNSSVVVEQFTSTIFECEPEAHFPLSPLKDALQLPAALSAITHFNYFLECRHGSAPLNGTVKRNQDGCAQLSEDIHRIIYAIIDLHITSESRSGLPPEVLDYIGKFAE
ncbi:hypothetical protein C8R44DRAFT_883297 [Mycena epipterygia]|nr:hypothetical protein C8R44DRAFT_883297 [Mycena epipterygia]